LRPARPLVYPWTMPRTARASVAHTWYHVLNRGNRREEVFHKPADFDAFVKAMADAHARLPVDILGYCLMPNRTEKGDTEKGDGTN
jgi:putative transposase